MGGEMRRRGLPHFRLLAPGKFGDNFGSENLWKKSRRAYNERSA